MLALNTDVEPQSLKKLSLKSVKRALDLFAPVHGQFPPADPERLMTSFACSVSLFSRKLSKILCFDDSSSLCLFLCRSKKIRLCHKVRDLFALSFGLILLMHSKFLRI